MELRHLRRRPRERVVNIAKRYTIRWMCLVNTELSVVKTVNKIVVMLLIFIFVCRFLQGPDIPERQLYKEPPAAFLEADPLEVRQKKTKNKKNNTLQR